MDKELIRDAVTSKIATLKESLRQELLQGNLSPLSNSGTPFSYWRSQEEFNKLQFLDQVIYYAKYLGQKVEVILRYEEELKNL